MNSYRKLSLAAFVALVLLLARQAIAQESADLTYEGQTASAPAPQKSATAPDDNWHLAIAPYLWFAAAHGTAGFNGRDVSYHASFGDIISKFNIGFMGAAQARKGRLILPVDFLWMKLSDDKGLPVNESGVTSIKAKLTQTLLTPKAGYRIIDGEKVKADATLGIRYWHLAENLTLQPSGLSNSQSANWVDAVAGGRIEMPLSPKASITVLGDAGAGGANVDYQVAGLLGYKVKPNLVLELGWRYLDVNYRPSSSFVYDGATTGIVLGVVFNVK